jgi:CrcB protein
MNFLLVFIGGGLGAVLRYGIGILWPQHNIWTSTLLANLIAALIIGALYAWQPITKTTTSSTLWIFLAIGFCGGLSTFSTFSLEIFQWMQLEKWGQCLAYIALNVVLCTLLIFTCVKLLGALK